MSETPEFSRPIGVGATEHGDIARHIEADAEERSRLARRFGLRAIERLVVDVRLRRVRAGRVLEVTGTLAADVVQVCVVTLEAFPAQVTEAFRSLYDLDRRAAATAPPTADELDLDPESDEAVEPLVDGRVDVGELAAQHLSLALEPYPRAPGVAFGGFDDEEPAGGGPATPFQVLDMRRRS